MNKKIFFLAVAIFMYATSFATIRKVTVGDNSFTPSAVKVHAGDTIMWVWTNGTHTTTSANIPHEAVPWNSNIDANTTSYIYVPTVTGTYNYQCSLTTSTGMTGSFTVTNITDKSHVSQTPIFTAYPNPASGSAHIVFKNANWPVVISITDMNGNVILEQHLGLVMATDIDITNIPDGTYFLHAERHNRATSQELIVQH
jgi:plastocyanin